MDLEWHHDKSRAYNRLQRIGIPTGKPKPKGHRHTQSLGQLSNLSPIPSLSSIATATSGASTTLNTPTSTSSFPVFQPKALEEELEDHTPTPTPPPKPRFRVPSSTPTTPSAPSFSKGKPLGRSDSLKSITSLSSAGSSLIRKLSLKSAASRSEALKTPPPRAQLVKPQTTHTMASPRGHRASSFDSERIGVVGKSGETHIQAHVDRDAIGSPSRSPSKRVSLDQKSSTLTHSTSATSTPTTRRRQHSESMPSTPLRKPSSASKPSPSRNQAHTPTQKRTQPQPQGSAPTQGQRPPSRSEHLLRSTLLKDDLAHSSANVTSANARPTTPTSSSSSSTHTHRRRHSHSSQTSSQTSTSRREARDSDLIASSFLFRTNLSSTSSTSPAIVSPTPRSSTTTNTRSMSTKPLFGFMADISDGEDESSSQGSGSAPGYEYGYGPTHGQGQGSRQGQYPGHTNSHSGLNTYTQQHHRNQHQSMHSPWEQHQDTPGRSQSFTHVDTARTQTHSAPRPPLTPHEQVLRARLERVLSAGTVGGAYASSKGKDREVDWDGEEERFEDYIGDRTGDARRKRSSLPVTTRDQEREREGSVGGLFGSIGWLWRGGQEQEQESPGSSSSEGNPQLPTPSTPGDGKEGYIQNLSPNRTCSPHAHTHSPRRIRSHTAPTPSPSTSRFHIQNSTLVHAHTPPSTRTQQSQSHSPSSSPIAAGAYLSPNPTNTTTPRGTPKRHVFSLEPVPSVGELRELAEEHEAAAAAVAGGAGKSPDVSNQGSDKGREMITPPPTPPRREKEFVLDGREDREETPRKVLPSQTQIKTNAVNANTLSQRRGSSSSVVVASAKMGAVALGRSKSARSVSTTIPNSKAGRTGLGLGRPTGLSRNGSTESRDDICVLPSTNSTPRRMTSPTKASFSSPTAPTFAVDTVSSAHVAPKDLALSLSPTSSVTLPASLLSGTSATSFNARTASMQCRHMEGYVSFASIEGLGEPPASANPSVGDGHSMFGDDEDGGKEGGGKRFLGWILGK